MRGKNLNGIYLRLYEAKYSKEINLGKESISFLVHLKKIPDVVGSFEVESNRNEVESAMILLEGTE